MNSKKSIALHYDGDFAPKIVYKGERLEADKIIQIAKEFDIPIMADQPLTEALFSCNINDYVPEDLWEIIAGIYAYIMSLKTEV